MHSTTARLTTFVTCLLLAMPALAQWDDARWYKVELLVFAQPQGSAAERWPASPDLAYPASWRFLVPLSASGGQAYDAQGRQVVDHRTAPAQDDSASAAEPAATALGANYSLLPRADREFRGKAAYMQRNAGYRILFHEHWLQGFVEGKSPPAIIVDSAAQQASWPELQGTIRLSLSRFLHLETNLWLNTDGRYLDGAWQMAAPPPSPAAILLLEDESTDADAALAQSTEAAAGAAAAAALPAAIDDNGTANTEVGPQYPFRHAVHMQQKRRMRSNEVHYLDHPMLGVIAKVTPLDAEDLDAYVTASRSVQ